MGVCALQIDRQGSKSAKPAEVKIAFRKQFFCKNNDSLSLLFQILNQIVEFCILVTVYFETLYNQIF